MKKGLVDISPHLITEAMNFPIGWEIEQMSMREGDLSVKVIISGQDFPESIDGKIEHCKIIVHRESIKFEVEPVF